MTSTDITIAESTGPEFERLQSMGAPQPGTYWKAIEAIPSQWSERLKINAVPAGEALLLLEVVEADGAPHSYVLAAHPRHGKHASNQRVHADDFHQLFEPAEDGHALRAKEIQRLQETIAGTQRAILSPPPEEMTVPTAQLAHDPQPSGGSALVTRDQVKAMAEYAASLQHRAEVQAKWIEKQTAKLSEQTGVLACFYSEAAQVQLARAKAQLAGVAGILKTVENLRLYTGDEVEVIQLRDGEAAASSEPLTIYQDLLAFDEEAAILVEQGGIDHTNVEQLTEAMEDIRLLERMIPAERGVALVRFRSTFKEFMKGDDIGTAMYNIEMNRVSKTNRLLVRDGEKAFLVSSGSTFDGLEQLLTSTGEQAAHFRDGEVRHEHLQYAKARASQLASLEKNAKALIVLWGLRDRSEILGGWSAPIGASWLDPAFQNDWMRLLSVDSLIGVKRPGYAIWRDEQNRSLAPGSWVAIHASAVVTPYSLEPVDLISIAQVYSERGALKAKVPLKSRYPSRRESRIKNSVLDLTAKSIGEGRVLCLDRASASDLHYYLTSRSQRREYSAYITLFREAARWVEARDREEAPVRNEIREAAAAVGLTTDAEAMDRVLTEAIAAARLSMRGAKIPDRSAPAFKTFMTTALDILYAKLKSADAIAEAAERAFGAGLVKVVMDRDGYRAYVQQAPEERDCRLPKEGLYQAVPFKVNDAGLEVSGPSSITTLDAKRGEEVIRSWGERWPQWKHKAPPELYIRLFDQVHDTSATAAKLLVPELASEIVARQLAYWRSSNSRHIRRMIVGIPIGTIRMPMLYDQAGILYLVADGLKLAANLGAESGKTAAQEAIKKWYATPANALELLDKSTGQDPWRPHGIWVNDHRQDLEPIRFWESARDAGFSVSKEDLRSKNVLVTTATELGVKLAPEIIDHVMAPTRSSL